MLIDEYKQRYDTIQYYKIKLLILLKQLQVNKFYLYILKHL